MSKKEAIKEFRRYFLPDVLERYGEKDQAAIREAWNNYTDGLCKDGRITPRQYEHWVGPFK